MNVQRPIPAPQSDEVKPQRNWNRLPNWPRLLPESLAAAYVGCVSIGTFRAEVKDKIWPQPIRRGRRVFWDLIALDRAVDAQSGLVLDTPPAPTSGLGEIKWGKSA
jgi:hypothetical protein